MNPATPPIDGSELPAAAAGWMVRLRRLSLPLTILAFGAVLLGLLWGVVFAKLRSEHRAESETATRTTENLARVFEEHSARTFREADQLALFIADLHREQGTKFDLRRLMEDGPVINRIYDGLSIVDERGNLTLRGRHAVPASFADSEHFIVHAAHDTNRLFIGTPSTDRISGKTSIKLSRRINKPDLTFGGVVVVSINPTQLSQFYSQLDVGERGMITLVGRDGVVRASRLGYEPAVKQDTRKWVLFKHLQKKERGNYVVTSPIDGVQRIFSYRALEDYPLVVAVGVATDEALAGFFQRRRDYYRAAGLVSAVILAVTLLLVVLVARQQKTATVLARRNLELSRAERLQREANERFELAARGSRDGLWDHEIACDRVYRSPRYLEMLGYAPEELRGFESFEALLHPDDRARVIAARCAHLERRTPFDEECRMRVKSGEYRWFRLRGQARWNDRGEPVHMSGWVKDVTERRAAEAERAQAAAIVRSSEDAIVSVTPEGAIVTWNAGAERLFGHTAQQAIGQHIELIYAPSLKPAARHNIEAIKQGERHYEAKRATRGGKDVAVSVTAFPILGGAGEVAGIGAIYRDISDRKKAEAGRKASEARLRAILDNVPECVAVVSTRGDLVEINRAGLDMFEVDDIDVVRDRGLVSFTPCKNHNRFTAFLGRAAGAESEVELEIMGARGTRRWIQARAVPIQLPEARNGSALCIARDVTERKLAQERIEYLSQYDALTTLPNRNLFRDRLENAVARARRRGEVLGILLVNLDRFKKVNESLGADAGDSLLRDVAQRLKDTLREVDTIARLSGNEYAVLVEGVLKTENVTAVAEKVVQALTRPFDVHGHEVVASASVGVAVCLGGTDNAVTLLENAEAAMSRAKQDGGGCYHLYEGDPVVLRSKRVSFESRLRHALENGEISVHYQPKISLRTGAITGAEGLLRWNNPELGEVSPAQFIPVAEETGLILPLGEWILHAACAQAKAWQERGLPFQIGVNLSPRQFRQRDLPQRVAAVLAATALAPGHLELEITETTAMANPDQAIAVLGDLRALGVKVAVDDFGTGYSSLSYLKRLPLDRLKIDRAFIKDLGTNSHDEAIVRATIALAGSLGLDVTAEGVETVRQRDLLASAGCHECQGFYFSPPLPAEEITTLLRHSRRGT